jgi:hypothetical protein
MIFFLIKMIFNYYVARPFLNIHLFILSTLSLAYLDYSRTPFRDFKHEKYWSYYETLSFASPPSDGTKRLLIFLFCYMHTLTSTTNFIISAEGTRECNNEKKCSLFLITRLLYNASQFHKYALD